MASLTDLQGRPPAIAVSPGNTGDPTTVADPGDKLRQCCGRQRVILGGDRGRLTQTQSESLNPQPGLGWLSAWRPETGRQRLDPEDRLRSPEPPARRASSCPEFPHARRLACFKPCLAPDRRRQRNDWLQATEQAWEKLVNYVQHRTKPPLRAADLGTQVGQVINRFPVGKHFATGIADGPCRYPRRRATIDRAAELDGGYVLRTRESQQTLSAADTGRQDKNLAPGERVFRPLKGREIQFRPLPHRTAARVRAPLLLCPWAY